MIDVQSICLAYVRPGVQFQHHQRKTDRKGREARKKGRMES